MTGSPQDAPPGSPVPRDPGSDPVVDPLLVRLRRREEAAFSEFVRQNQDQVFGIVFRYLRNRAEAEDVAQEVFVTVFKSIEGFRGESKISTWLFRIATNHAKNRLRYRGRRAHGRHREFEAVAEYAVDDGGVLGERPPRPDEAAAGYELEGTIGNALATLDPDHRKLIVLREIEGRTYEEMITMTGLAPGTLKSKLHRARHALMEAVQRQGGNRDDQG
ncbi:MAG: sigma-70 family RNA polymerase sigma factor [Myxococcales bacterium]|nr:sigma-70 family RNA polymerase sigma factor [Myxococcales bacterium]